MGMTNGGGNYGRMQDSILPGVPRNQNPLWIAADDFQKFMVSNIRENNDFVNLLSYSTALDDPEVKKMDATLTRRTEPHSLADLKTLETMGFNAVLLGKLKAENVGSACPFPPKQRRVPTDASTEVSCCSAVCAVFASIFGKTSSLNKH